MESLVAKLKEDTRCSLCKNTLRDPRLLECFHTLCKQCIKDHISEPDNTFKCPECGDESLPQTIKDVDDLPFSHLYSKMVQVLESAEGEKSCSVSASHSVALSRCIDCDRSMCDECLKCHNVLIKGHRLVSLTEIKDDDVLAMLTAESPCRNHSNNKLAFFCEGCKVLICWTCMEDHHIDHKMVTLQEFKANKKASLTKALEEIERLGSAEREREKKQQGSIAISMKNDSEKAKEEVRRVTKKLVKHIFDEEERLLEEIQRSVKRADRNVCLIRHNSTAKEYIKRVIDNATARDLIDLEDRDGSTMFTYNPFKVDTTGIVFDTNNKLLQSLGKATLGEVRHSCLSNPVMSKIQSPYDNWQVDVLRKTIVSVLTKDSSGNVNTDYKDIADITFTPEGIVKNCKTLPKEDGKINFEFVPRMCGEATVGVTLNGNALPNSPIKVVVRAQNISQAFGFFVSHQKLKNTLDSISKDFTVIAVSNDKSKIAVLDCGSYSIRVFNMEGDLLLLYGSKGSNHDQLSNPQGLAFINNVDLAIADSGNNRVCIVNTTTGSLLKMIDFKGKREFDEPYGLHVDEHSNIIVCNNGNSCFQVFNKEGEFQYEFSLPSGIRIQSVVACNGLFYVSDLSKIHVIERTENTSKVVRTIEGDSSLDWKLQEPLGLALDSDNNLLVCDQVGYIYKLTLDGHLLGKSSKLNKKPKNITDIGNDEFIVATEGSKYDVFFIALNRFNFQFEGEVCRKR